MKQNQFAIGCWIDGNQSNVTEGSLELIDIAEGYGFAYEDASGILENPDHEDYAETVEFIADDAERFLNELEDVPPLTSFYWYEGMFGLWPDVDDDETPKVDELPELVYQVSDHGNVTLYRASYVEVWGVV